MRRFASVVGIAALVGCGGGGGGEAPAPPPAPRAAVIRIATGDFQSADPGSILRAPVVVQVTDASGFVLSNVTLTIAVQAGGGLVGSASEQPTTTILNIDSDVAGFARFQWQVGPDTVNAQIVHITGATVQSPIDATARAQNSYFALIASGNDQSVKAGELAQDPLIVRTVDARNNSAPRVKVQWTTSLGVTVVSSDTISDANGLARAQVRAGTRPLTALSVANARTGSAQFRTTVVPGDPALLDIVPRLMTLPMEGMLDTFRVKVLDRYQNEIPDRPVSLAIADTNVATDWGVHRIRGKEAGSTFLVLRSDSVVDSLAIRVPSFLQVFVNDGACGITVTHEARCWSRASAWDRGTIVGTGPAATATFGSTSCLAYLSGTTSCWGFNDGGALGGGDAVTDNIRDPSNPVTVLGGHHFVQLTSGVGVVCGLEVDGTAYCWGNTNYTGTDSSTSPCGVVSCTSRPVPVKGNLHFAQISTFTQHTCGVTVDGDGYCWGASAAGALGSTPRNDCRNGEASCSARPELVTGGHKWRYIAAGAYHTCGLSADGETYCWGANGTGALGTGSFTPDTSTLPLRVVGGLQFVSVTAGVEVSCGLTHDGRAFCWGGRLSTAPEARLPGLRFSAIAASPGGGDPFCGISVGGGIHCLYQPEFLVAPSGRRRPDTVVTGRRRTPLASTMRVRGRAQP